MASTNPITVILIPGMCTKANVYEPLVKELETTHAMHSVQALELPSADALTTGADLTPTPLEADTRAIRAALEHAVTQRNHDVVIVAHSYGGTPALHATRGLWAGRGRSGAGVQRVLLLSAGMSLGGESVAGVRGAWAAANPAAGVDDQAGVRIDVHDGAPFVVPEEALWPAWLNDLAPEDQRRWGAASLVPSPLGTVAVPVPEALAADPKEWKIKYMICAEDDRAMPTAFQEYLVQKTIDAGAEVETTKIKSGHFVQLSHTKEVAAWVAENSKP